MAGRADVVIVGGGAVCSAVAYFLAALPQFGGYRNLDLSRLSPRRLVDGKPLTEQHAVRSPGEPGNQFLG